MCFKRRNAAVLALLVVAFTAFGNDAMKKALGERKFADVIKQGEAIAADARTVEQWIMLGNAQEQMRNDPQAREKAKRFYDGAMRANPSHPAVYLALGNFELRGNNHQEALRHFQRSHLLEGTSAAAEGMAVAASNLRDWERARDAAETAISLDADAIQSRQILAKILFDGKSFAAAAPHLEHIAARKPREIETWRQLVVCYENTKNAEALAKVDPKIIELDAKDVKSRQRHAEWALSKGDTKTALSLFKDLALLTPNDAKPFKNLYEASLKDGNKKDGIMYLRNFVVLDSSDASAIRQLADLLYEAKDIEGALNAYRKAVRRDANIKGVSKNHAAIVLERKLDDEAIRVVQRAITLKEADAAMYEAAGDIYSRRNDHANAIRMYNAALDLDKQNLPLLTKVAQAQAASGNIKNAIVSYQQIVLLNPQAVSELKILADLTTRDGKVKEGIDIFKRYFEKAPNDQEVAVRIGMFEYNNKQFKDAVSFLTKVRDNKLLTTDVLFALGDSYAKLEDCKNAIASFERVRASKPSNQVLVNTLRPLAECYEKEGNKAKAAEMYTAFAALPNVRDADASFLRAFLREDADRAGAVKIYEANTKDFPRDHRSFMRLGLIHSRDNAALQQAVTNLTAASRLTDTVAIIWKTLGEVQGKLKNTDGELAAYTRLLALQPDDVTANKRVGTIQINRKQWAPGIASLEKVVAADDKDFEASMLLAAGYSNTNRHKEASDQLKRAKALKADDVSIRLSLIDALEKSGDSTGVRDERRSLADLDRRIANTDKKNVESRQRLVVHSMANKDNATAYLFLNELAALTPRDQVVFKNLYDMAMASGKKKEAIGHLRKYIALRPNIAEAHKNLGLLLHEEKDFDGALASFREARKLDPAITGIYKEYLAILIERKLNDEIITAGNAAIAAKEADASVYVAMGDIHRSQNRHADAVRMYKAALDLDTKNVALLAKFAESQARSGDLRNAEISYEQVIAMNPNAVAELKELGAIQARLGKQEQAMTTYKKYLEKNKGDEEIALLVGNFEHGKKQFEAAVRYLEMVKKPELQNMTYLINLADSYFQLKNHKKAAEFYDRVWKSRNVTPAVLRNILKPLGEAYEADNQPVKAAEAYRAFVAIQGVVDQEASFKRAFLVEKTDEAAAIRDYTANLRTFPRDPRNFLRLGMIQSQSQNRATLEQAATNLNAAVKLADNNADAWLALAKVNGTLNRTNDELAALRKYVQLNPQDFSANRRMGEIAHGRKQFQDAITNLEIFAATTPNDVEVIVMLVDAYEATNRQGKAAELLARAKTLRPNDPAVRERLYLMYKKDGERAKAEAEIRDLVNITKDNRHRLMYFNDLVEAKKLEEASRVANEIRRSDPLNYEGLMAVADIQRLQRRFAEAVETYKSVLFIDPPRGSNHASAFFGRAEAHLGMREMDRAESFFKRAIETDPRMARAEIGLVKVYRAQNKTDLMNTHAGRARTIAGNNQELLGELNAALAGQAPPAPGTAAPAAPVAPASAEGEAAAPAAEPAAAPAATPPAQNRRNQRRN